jgi:hypothetical protein
MNELEAHQWAENAISESNLAPLVAMAFQRAHKAALKECSQVILALALREAAGSAEHTVLMAALDAIRALQPPLTKREQQAVANTTDGSYVS